MPQQCLLGNLPGFVHSHDGYPREGDLFWSPADWAWTGGLMDALLPALYFGQPIVGYRGRFDPDRALGLIEKYGVRNAFLFPTALKMLMKAHPRPRERFDVHLRTVMSAGEAVGTAVFDWARDALGVTINEMFGQTEMNYVVGNSHELWPAKPGSMGRPYPGPQHRRDRRRRPRGRRRRDRRGRGQPHRARWQSGPRLLPRVLRESRGDRAEIHRRLVPHRRPRAARRRGLPLVPGPRRRHVQGGRLPDRPVGDRELPRPPPGGRERRGGPLARRDARQRREGVHRARGGPRAVGGDRERHPRARAALPRALRIPEGDRVHRRAADDDDRQGAAARAARARARTQGGARPGRGAG